MTPDEAVRAVAARLSTIGWERHGDKTWSKAALLKGYSGGWPGGRRLPHRER
ncbi:hypothetical protein ACWEOZ_09585 [Actinoplanes sp. NPDC004185]